MTEQILYLVETQKEQQPEVKEQVQEEQTQTGFPDLSFGEMTFPDFDLEMRI